MRSSIIIATLFAALAVANPVHQQLHKKAYVWDVVTEIVTVTVTAGQEPVTIHTQKTVFAPKKVITTRSRTRSRTRSTTTSTTTTPPPPPPTSTTPPPPPSTTEAPPPPSTTEPPPPPPTTTQAPPPTTEAPAPQTSQAAPQQETTQAAAPVVVDTPSSSSGDIVKDTAINKHNTYRAKHHAGPVTWDDSLASSAAALAQGCTNKHGLIVGGQNIAAKGVSGQAGPSDQELISDAIDSWYNEVDLFGPYYGQANVGDSSVLHFTQVVWKATTKIGCAVNNCGTTGNIFPGFNAYTIVCNYLSAGNFGGQYAANVQAP